MNRNDHIIVTGAAGFIAGGLVTYLNELGFERLILVDDFSRQERIPNYLRKEYLTLINRDELEQWLEITENKVHAIFHLGARTDTAEFNYEVLEKLNVDYSKMIWNYCTKHQVPLVYASSAATYGNGELGYDDDETIIDQLQPLNPYGISKNEFDKWALAETVRPPFFAGVKFFNVYGPNEYHKGRMGSVVMHAFNQIQAGADAVKLFRSHNPDFEDGGQSRDFVYVKDVIKMCVWLMNAQPESGLYNVGTGIARSFKDLVLAVFSALGKEPSIEFIDTPEDIRDKYQYFTEANMEKMKGAGYPEKFYSLENGVRDYVLNYLLDHKYY